MATHLWLDPSRGVAGDMLLGALLDAGASVEAVRTAIETVLPRTVDLVASSVQRAGMRATHVEVVCLVPDQPHRLWREIRQMLTDARLPDGVRTHALRAFALLADAEARAHGIPADDVHFHEVGAWDSIADVVGVCAAIDDLGVTTVSSGAVALGSGSVRTSHGDIPVPVPAVLELSRGWAVHTGGEGELATPTGLALVRALAEESGPLPAMTVRAVGVGAGTRDTPGRPNVVRAVLGALDSDRRGPADAAGRSPGAARRHHEPMTVLEANVDDLDPRLWPGVIASLLSAGALDAWTTPIVMKKGRPAHQLGVLAAESDTEALLDEIFRLVPTLGVRHHAVQRTALDRAWAPVEVDGQTVRIKVGSLGGEVLTATPEFEDVRAAAGVLGLAEREVMERARHAGRAAGLHT